jgi:hypothetical protein
VRGGLFRRAAIVRYTEYQDADPLAYAVAELSAALDHTFRKPEQVTASLQATPTLVILDNLEAAMVVVSSPAPACRLASIVFRSERLRSTRAGSDAPASERVGVGQHR